MKTSRKRRPLRRRMALTAAALFSAGALLFGVAAPASAYPGYWLRPVSGKTMALDIWDANNYVGAWVGTYRQNSGWNQRFDLVSAPGGYQIRSQNGLCLRVGNYDTKIRNTPIATAYCNAGDRGQIWAQSSLTSGGSTLPGLRYKNLATNNCLDATDDKWVVDYPCHNGDNQRWDFVNLGW